MEIRALTFDVFGTVVDWRSAIIAELETLAQKKEVQGDWAAFVDEWKAFYRPAMDAVNSGERPWTNVDEIYARALDELLPRYGLTNMRKPEIDHLTHAWCRPHAWPDSAPALHRLKEKFALSTLSNGNFSWLVAIAKHCSLPFDCVLTAENARAYKPDPRVYRCAIEMLGLRPEQILMVACHNYDLAAASSHGMRTAFLPRKEHGGDQTADQAPEHDWDFVVRDLEDLATALSC
ncbi:MAG: haloacid dehalogenase type II [Hyphomicrobiales bacterium]|nr:haloacid dehalogenase type II [Hyphomicrobiales bacterium]